MAAIPLASPDAELAEDTAHAVHETSFLRRYIFATDHKVIALQFLFVSLIFMVIGGLLAMLIRWQLGWPQRPVPILGQYMYSHGLWNATYMPPEFYNSVFTMHATLMIWFVIIPLLVGVFGNYLIPLKIGAADMAFPFLNGASFWAGLPAGAIMAASFFLPNLPASNGWTSYPPLSEIRSVSEPLAAPLQPAPYAAPADLGERLANQWHGLMQALRIQDAATAHQGVWPDISLVMTFLALFLCFGYFCAYCLRVAPEHDRPRWSAGLVGCGLLLVIVGAACFRLNGRQSSARFLPLLGLGLILSGLMLVGGLRVNAAVSAILCEIAAVLVLWGLQYAVFDGQSAWLLSLALLGFATIMGALNYVATVVKLRCPGMTMFRLPLSVWALFINSILVLLATPVLAAALILNLLDHHGLTSFFRPSDWIVSTRPQWMTGGGYPLLHQHLFWFYSHPAVYIMILPAMGMVSDILAAGARKPVFGYRPMVYALTAIAFLGFVVWAHHMFQSGMNPTLATTFMISTIFIAVPSAIKTFNWLGTLWGGNIRFTTPFLHAVAFVSMFVIGGLSGIYMASTPVDVAIHDTYFIVAHIHYVLFGASMFGIFAAITFWYPKMFGRMMSERLGMLHWAISFIAFNCTFFPMHVMGIHGVARRLYDLTSYSTFSGYQPMNRFISVSAFVMGAAQALFAVNFLGSWFWGRRAGRNPWEATTLEWQTASPPPHGNFPITPVVHHGPYEYSSPLVEEDYLVQTRWVRQNAISQSSNATVE